MSRKILVLGATGFIGTHVVTAMLQSDWATPIAASRRTPTDITHTPIRRQCDGANLDSLRHACEDVDGVVNCVAGNVRTILANARALQTISKERAASLTVVHLSSMAVYGSATGTVAEDAPLLGDLGAYSAAKVQAERILGALENVVILRPGIVYGPGSRQWSERIGMLLIARRLGDLGSLGDGNCNLVFVEDVAAAVLNALRCSEARGHAFNLSLASPFTWNDYFIHYGKSLGAVPVARISRRRLKTEAYIFAPPLKVLEILAQRSQIRALPRLPPPITPSLVRLCQHDIRLATGEAESALRMRWQPVAEGLRLSAAALISQLLPGIASRAGA